MLWCDKAAGTFNAMQGGRLLRLAIGVSIHFPRRPFVIIMPAGIKQQRHQRDADQKQNNYMPPTSHAEPIRAKLLSKGEARRIAAISPRCRPRAATTELRNPRQSI